MPDVPRFFSGFAIHTGGLVSPVSSKTDQQYSGAFQNTYLPEMGIVAVPHFLPANYM